MTLKKIQSICKQANVFYHHHDECSKGTYEDEDLSNAVIVIYSSQYGPWRLAINHDESISTPGLIRINQLQSFMHPFTKKPTKKPR